MTGSGQDDLSILTIGGNLRRELLPALEEAAACDEVELEYRPERHEIAVADTVGETLLPLTFWGRPGQAFAALRAFCEAEGLMYFRARSVYDGGAYHEEALWWHPGCVEPQRRTDGRFDGADLPSPAPFVVEGSTDPDLA